MHVGKFRIDRDRRLEACQRLVEAMQLLQATAAMIEGVDKVRLERERRVEEGERLGQAAELVQDQSDIGDDLGTPGRERKRAFAIG